MSVFRNLGLAIAMLFMVAACGGGGGGGGGSPCLAASCGGSSSTPASSENYKIDLSVSAPSLVTDGASTVTVTAVLKDSGNATVSGKTVTLTASSGTISQTTTTTDSSGAVQGTFNTNTDKNNRSVTITATYGSSLVATTTIDVTGTSLAFSGDLSGALGKAVTMSVTLTDAANKAIVGQSIKLTSALGNPLPASVTSNSAGLATFTFTPTKSGTETLVASAMNATTSRALSISAVSFYFSSPAANSTIVFGGCQPVTVTSSGFTPSSVMFNTSRGTIYADSACAVGAQTMISVPVSSGQATAYIRSGSAGGATITATAAGGASGATATLPVFFLAGTPASLTVQADPSTLTPGGTSTITALVKDASGNVVSSQLVVFSATTGGGTFSSTNVTTDSAGYASTVFTADPSFTGAGAIVVTAAVPSTSAANSTSLTIAGKSVNVAISTNNLVLTDTANPAIYSKAWQALVTDSNGSPVKNQTVSISVLGVKFAKGYWQAGTDSWIQNLGVICYAEDADNNGVITAGELGDLDQDGVLEPNGAASVRPESGSSGASVTVTTNSQGLATFYLDYLRRYGSWVFTQVKATASVSGKNSVAASSFWLPVPSSEVKDKDNSPAFQWSPFGLGASCWSHNE